MFGSVNITDNATSGPTVQTYNLMGTGVWPISLSPASLSFPATVVGSSSPALQVTVTNRSSTAVTVVSLALSGDYNLVPLGANPCVSGTVLNASETCTAGITFSPTVTGTISGVMTVAHNAPNSPQVTTITGTGQ